MLKSYVSFAARGDVVLQREIMTQLGIGPNGILYGALSPSENCLILSPIPPTYWKKALKIIIHTYHLPGSLAVAASAVAGLGMDTISSWASSESSEGHACFTSIVIFNPAEELPKDLSIIASKLTKAIGDSISDLPIFSESKLLKVRVTPLSFLDTYGSELKDANFHKVAVEDHSLRLGKSKPLEGSNEYTLWQQILTANQGSLASSCILTPDTEEAFLRISIVKESARLIRLAFRVKIQNDNSSFAGYWKEALEIVKGYNYNVFTAHNLLISKEESPSSEEAEFHFITDRWNSSDKGIPFSDLQKIWLHRIESRLVEFAKKRKATLGIEGMKVTRPKGVGVPCFFACNAKYKDGVGAEAAVHLCRLLEGHGFKPVNIDLASGGVGLQEQVRKLVLSCSFMIVLHCPEEKLKDPNSDEYTPSDWVIFEESVMLGAAGKIIRLRFEKVRSPSFTAGYVETTIPMTGITDHILEDFTDRLDRWVALMYEFNNENVFSQNVIEDKDLERDLVVYYGGRAKKLE